MPAMHTSRVQHDQAGGKQQDDAADDEEDQPHRQDAADAGQVPVGQPAIGGQGGEVDRRGQEDEDQAGQLIEIQIAGHGKAKQHGIGQEHCPVPRPPTCCSMRLTIVKAMIRVTTSTIRWKPGT